MLLNLTRDFLLFDFTRLLLFVWLWDEMWIVHFCGCISQSVCPRRDAFSSGGFLTDLLLMPLLAWNFNGLSTRHSAFPFFFLQSSINALWNKAANILAFLSLVARRALDALSENTWWYDVKANGAHVRDFTQTDCSLSFHKFSLSEPNFYYVPYRFPSAPPLFQQPPHSSFDFHSALSFPTEGSFLLLSTILQQKWIV